MHIHIYHICFPSSLGTPKKAGISCFFGSFDTTPERRTFLLPALTRIKRLPLVWVQFLPRQA